MRNVSMTKHPMTKCGGIFWSWGIWSLVIFAVVPNLPRFGT
jgi:hypothetical protein